MVLGGDTFFSQCSLYIKLLSASIVWKFVGNKPYTFTFNFNGSTFIYELEDSTDIAALEEIYIEQEYSWLLPFAPKIILDLGANFGDTTLYYRAMYPDALIIAVEPSAHSFQRLRKHTAHDTKIIAVQAALGSDNGDQNLYLMPGSSLGHSMVKRRNDMQATTVSGVTLTSLFQQYAGGVGFDLVKFDIEGAEVHLFSGLELENISKAFIGELHFDLMSVSQQSVLKELHSFESDLRMLQNIDRYIVRALAKK